PGVRDAGAEGGGGAGDDAQRGADGDGRRHAADRAGWGPHAGLGAVPDEGDRGARAVRLDGGGVRVRGGQGREADAGEGGDRGGQGGVHAGGGERAGDGPA